MSWNIDLAHSQIQFAVRHMMISTVRGKFANFEGVVEFDEQNPSRSKVSVKIAADSINTGIEQRDAHLRSADFFNVEEYPYLTFESTRVEQIDASHGRIYGNLTIRDVSREVVLETEYAGQAKSPWGSYSAGFSASTKINRKDWGLTYNQALETGGVLVGDEIKINIDLEIVKQAEQVEEQELQAA